MKNMTRGDKALVLTSAAILVALFLITASTAWAWHRISSTYPPLPLTSRDFHWRGYTLRANLTNAPNCFTFHRNCIVDSAPHKRHYLTLWITQPNPASDSPRRTTHKLLEIPLPALNKDSPLNPD